MSDKERKDVFGRTPWDVLDGWLEPKISSIGMWPKVALIFLILVLFVIHWSTTPEIRFGFLQSMWEGLLSMWSYFDTTEEVTFEQWWDEKRRSK